MPALDSADDYAADDFVLADGSMRVPGRYVNGLEAELSGRPGPALDLSLERMFGP